MGYDSRMKVRECLALIRAEPATVKYETRLRALQALLNADKLHHLTDREQRELDKSIKWGEITPKGFQRLPIDEDPITGY